MTTINQAEPPASDVGRRPHGSPGNTHHFKPLDGIRGLAIILVVLTHSFQYDGSNPLGRVFLFVAHLGWSGVTLFFVLSGFLISGILLDTSGKPHALRDFYARRSLRIFPLYFGFLAFYLLLVPWVAPLASHLPQPSARLAACYWLYVANMREWFVPHGAPTPTLDPLWSLAVEEQVYLCWPLLIFTVPRRRLTTVFLALVIVSFGWRFGTRFARQSVELTYAWTPANLEAFAVGGAVAFLFRQRFELLRRFLPWTSSISVLVLAGLAFRYHSLSFWRAPNPMLIGGTSAFIMLYGSLIGYSVAADEKNRLNRFFSFAPLRSMGKYSYAIYLFHASVIAVLSAFIGGEGSGSTGHTSLIKSIALTAADGTVSYGLALFSWYLWESHFLKLKRFFPSSSNVLVSRIAHRSRGERVASETVSSSKPGTKTLRARFRHSPLYQVPFWTACKLSKRYLEPAVLKTARVDTDAPRAGAGCEVHLMTYDSDWQMALWALKSFYFAAQVSWPLVIHEGGTLGAAATSAIRRHFPYAVLKKTQEADAEVEPILRKRGLVRVLKARASQVMMRKMVDSFLLAKSPRILAFDSDVLFFRRPNELIVAGEEGITGQLYARDCLSVYNINADQVRGRFGLDLVERLNAGLVLLNRESFHLDALEEFLAEPQVSKNAWIVEQTLQALHASRYGATFMPETYLVSTIRGMRTVEGEPLICKHYPCGSRPMYYLEGLTTLLRSGFLRQSVQRRQGHGDGMKQVERDL